MAKVHGSLNGAGRVKNFTRDLKVSKQEKPVHPPRGRACKRALYIRRIVNSKELPNGRRAPCNPQMIA